MKILLLSPLPPPAGGIATWTEAYCWFCYDHGHEVCVVNTALRGRRVEKRRNLLREIERTVSIVGAFCRQIHKKKYDVVHINTSCSPLGLLRDTICMLLAGSNKTVLHCHCNVEDQIGSSRLANKLLKYAAMKASVILVLNTKSKIYIEALSGKPAQIVPNFIDASFVSENHEIRPEIQKVVFVGHIRREKGIFEILTAAAKLLDVEFQLVGPVCEDFSEELIPSNVQMVGTKTRVEIMEILQAADVFVFPSYTEGFSVAMLEAMASGLPIIATDVGANRDMIEEFGGILVTTKSSEAIVSAIVELATDAERRANMSKWNIQKVQRLYSADTVLGSLLQDK